MTAYGTTFNALAQTLDRIASRADHDRRLAREEEADARDELVIDRLRKMHAEQAALLDDYRARTRRLTDALDECREYFEDRADADQEPGDSYPTPNEEMNLLVLIDEATGRRP